MAKLVTNKEERLKVCGNTPFMVEKVIEKLKQRGRAVFGDSEIGILTMKKDGSLTTGEFHMNCVNLIYLKAGIFNLNGELRIGSPEFVFRFNKDGSVEAGSVFDNSFLEEIGKSC